MWDDCRVAMAVAAVIWLAHMSLLRVRVGTIKVKTGHSGAVVVRGRRTGRWVFRWGQRRIEVYFEEKQQGCWILSAFAEGMLLGSFGVRDEKRWCQLQWHRRWRRRMAPMVEVVVMIVIQWSHI